MKIGSKYFQVKRSVLIMGKEVNIANCANIYYAVYSGAATFYHGQAKATTTNVTQYYNTNGAYKITAPSSLTAISGWTPL